MSALLRDVGIIHIELSLHFPPLVSSAVERRRKSQIKFLTPCFPDRVSGFWLPLLIAENEGGNGEMNLNKTYKRS